MKYICLGFINKASHSCEAPYFFTLNPNFPIDPSGRLQSGFNIIGQAYLFG